MCGEKLKRAKPGVRQRQKYSKSLTVKWKQDRNLIAEVSINLATHPVLCCSSLWTKNITWYMRMYFILKAGSPFYFFNSIKKKPNYILGKENQKLPTIFFTGQSLFTSSLCMHPLEKFRCWFHWSVGLFFMRILISQLSIFFQINIPMTNKTNK